MKPVDPGFDPGAVQPGAPAWRIALLYPLQGSWTEHDYLSLDAGRLIDFDSGSIEVHDLPTLSHQRIVQFIYRALFAFLNNHRRNPVVAGEVFVAPLPVRLWQEKFREPDLVFISRDRELAGQYPDGADIVFEVVSSDPVSRRRDTVDKVREYAQAEIAEYWIVDPQTQQINVGQRVSDGYRFAAYRAPDSARSERLPGFHLAVNDVFEIGQAGT